MKCRLRFLFAIVAVAVAVVPIDVAAAEVAADDVEVILAIDASGSMLRAIDAAKTAANEFVASMPAEVRIGVETFADTVTVLTPPTTDRALLTAQIDSIEASGDTALYDVVVTATQHFTPAAEHKVLVLLSDGKDEGSLATLEDAITAIQGVHVEAISLATAETDLESLTALGPVTSAEDAAGVSAAFARVASLLAEVIEPIAVPSSTDGATTSAPATSVVAATPTVATTATSLPAAAVTTATEASDTSVWLWLGAAGLFCGLFVLTLLVWPRERVSKARLGIDTPRNVSEIGTRTVSAVEEALERHGKRADLGNALAVADISIKPAEFVAVVGVTAVVAGLAGLALVGPLMGLLVAGSILVAVRFYVRRTKAKRQEAFAEQLPDVLQLVTTALRSGYGITQALESVSEDAEQPARGEFARVLVEVRLGRDLSDAMRALARRMENIDLEWVVSAIDINRETGGNLSEVLQRVSETIRERARLARQVRTLTAEGRLSTWILVAFPFVMLLWQWRASPDNFDLLTYGGGLVLLVIAGILMVIGSVWVHKIVNSVAY
jgi:tight adherence protein B